ncbi:MAG: hypothetical protein RLZZ71_2320 [Bacteroidota bacterium]|jgi:hypothetical protein
MERKINPQLHQNALKHLISFLFLLLGFVALAQPVGNEYLYFSIIEVNGTDTVAIDKMFIRHSHRIEKLRIKNYRINNLSESNDGFRRLSMDDYYCMSTIKNNLRLQIIKDKRDTMNLIINNAKGMVFFQTQFQKGDFVVNVQQKDYDQNPRKVVRKSGTTAMDISRVNITLISETRVIFDYFYSRNKQKSIFYF